MKQSGKPLLPHFFTTEIATTEAREALALPKKIESPCFHTTPFKHLRVKHLVNNGFKVLNLGSARASLASVVAISVVKKNWGQGVSPDSLVIIT